MTPVPILIHMPYFHGGGAEVALVNLANHWHAKGRDVTFVVNDDQGPVRQRLDPAVAVASLNARRTYMALPKLSLYLAGKKPPLLVSALISSNIAGAVATRLASKTTAHVALVRNHLSMEIAEEEGLKKRAFTSLLKWSLRTADEVACVSSSARDDAIDFADLDPGSVSVTMNAAKVFNADELAAPEGWRSDGVPTIVCAGRLAQQKDMKTAIRAFHLLVKRRRARLLIAGEGPLRADIENLIASLDLGEHVTLLGYRSDVQRFVANADVLLLTSLYEGFPNVIAEALRVGTNVVATDAPGGAREILGDGAYGFLAPVGDQVRLADALETALARPLGSEVLKSRAGDFDIEKIADNYEAAFDRALSRKAIKNGKR